MNAAEKNNGPSSEQISTGEPNLAKERDEVTLLTDEAEAAKASILRLLDQLKGDLESAADLRVWAQVHPWGVVGLAAAAGWAAAATVAPSSRAEPPRAPPPREEPHVSPPAAPSAWSWLLIPLVDLIKHTAERLVNAAIEAGSPRATEAQPNGKVPASTTSRGSARGESPESD